MAIESASRSTTGAVHAAANCGGTFSACKVPTGDFDVLGGGDEEVFVFSGVKGSEFRSLGMTNMLTVFRGRCKVVVQVEVRDESALAPDTTGSQASTPRVHHVDCR